MKKVIIEYTEWKVDNQGPKKFTVSLSGGDQIIYDTFLLLGQK